MIRIQKLVEPKVTSGKKLEKGQKLNFHGVVIENKNAQPIYVDWYERKPWKKKKAAKKSSKAAKSEAIRKEPSSAENAY